MPDGSFNGIEIIWVVALIALIWLALFAARRWDRRVAEARDRLANESLETILDSTFEADAGWPRRVT